MYDNNEDVVQAFKQLVFKYPNIKHIVITGGEPLLHAEALKEFLSRVNYYSEYFITVETNGTMKPITYKTQTDENHLIDMYSISPKLSTSVARKPFGQLTQEDINRHQKLRINIEALKALITNSYDFQLKFVYSGPEAEQEIDELLEKLKDDNETSKCNSADKHVMLMPEGITNEQLSCTRKESAEICVRRGWQYTDRIHIIIWGDKRGF